jgi:hypothetical protein
MKKRYASRSYERIYRRLRGMKAIDPQMDLGNGLTIENIELLTNELRDAMNSYNDRLAEAELIRSDLEELEKQANDVAERIFTGVATKYGRDSKEYQRVGGKRKSRIKFTGTRPKTFDESEAAALVGNEPGSLNGTSSGTSSGV